VCLEIALSSGNVCHEGSPLQSSFFSFLKDIETIYDGMAGRFEYKQFEGCHSYARILRNICQKLQMF
jgi:hypothetical protein